jgi:hypothetical protein
MMNTCLTDVVVLTKESLDERTFMELEGRIRKDAGVVSVGHNPHQRHLMMVVYDSTTVHASNFLHIFQERGLHARVIGM